MSGLLGMLVANLGWFATGVFTASYFCKRADILRLVQMLGASLWLAYGIAISAPPVIVSNLLLLTVAGATLLRARGGRGNPA